MQFMMLFPDQKHHVLLLIAIFFLSLGLYGLTPYINAQNWIATNSLIKSIDETSEQVKEQKYTMTTYFYPSIEYSYEYNGKLYVNNKVSFDKKNIWTTGYNNWGDKLKETEKFWHNWKPGDTINIFVNASKPDQAVIIRELTKHRKSHHYAMVATGAIMFCIWLLTSYLVLQR